MFCEFYNRECFLLYWWLCASFTHVSLNVVTVSSDLHKLLYKDTLIEELGHLTI